jgi:hypothetical protein
MAMNPQHENLTPLWRTALGRLGTEAVRVRLKRTGYNPDTEFRNLLPGTNRNPSREFVETWLESRRRRARHMELAAQIIMTVVGAVGVAIAFHSIVLAA